MPPIVSEEVVAVEVVAFVDCAELIDGAAESNKSSAAPNITPIRFMRFKLVCILFTE